VTKIGWSSPPARFTKERSTLFGFADAELGSPGEGTTVACAGPTAARTVAPTMAAKASEVRRAAREPDISAG
jgi:hypothetical protein